jgi:hypothetical protein
MGKFMEKDLHEQSVEYYQRKLGMQLNYAFLGGVPSAAPAPACRGLDQRALRQALLRGYNERVLLPSFWRQAVMNDFFATLLFVLFIDWPDIEWAVVSWFSPKRKQIALA